jgi:hypothetical protein
LDRVEREEEQEGDEERREERRDEVGREEEQEGDEERRGEEGEESRERREREGEGGEGGGWRRKKEDLTLPPVDEKGDAFIPEDTTTSFAIGAFASVPPVSSPLDLQLLLLMLVLSRISADYDVKRLQVTLHGVTQKYPNFSALYNILRYVFFRAGIFVQEC